MKKKVGLGLAILSIAVVLIYLSLARVYRVFPFRHLLGPGEYRRYSPSGKVAYESLRGRNDFGKQIVKDYYPSGKLASKQVYKDGRLLDKRGNLFNGIHRYYYENGNVMAEEDYKDGVIKGFWRGFHEDGTLKYEFLSDGHNRHVSGTFFYQDGTPEMTIEKRQNEQ